MTQSNTILATTAALLLGMVGAPLAAQEQADPQSQAGEEQSAGDSQHYIGQSVFDADGRQVGIVDNVTMAEDGSEIAVLSVGEFLGLGAKKVAIPTSALQPNADGTGLATSISAEEFEAAPDYSETPAPEAE